MDQKETKSVPPIDGGGPTPPALDAMVADCAKSAASVTSPSPNAVTSPTARPTAAAVALAYSTPSPGAKSSNPKPPAAAQLLKKIALDAASKAVDQLCGGQTPPIVPWKPPAPSQARSDWSTSTVEYDPGAVNGPPPDEEAVDVPESIEVATPGSAEEHVGKRRAAPVGSPTRSARAAKLARNLDAAAAEAGAVPLAKSHSAELAAVKKEGK